MAIFYLLPFVGLLFTCLLFWMAEKSVSDLGVAAAIVGLLCGTFSVLALLFSFSVAYSLHGAKYKAEVINREYGTSYTAEEIYWAGSVIDTVRELDRKRIEVNGDLFREKSDQ